MKRRFFWGLAIVLFGVLVLTRLYRVHAPDPAEVLINGPKTGQVRKVTLDYCVDGDTMYFSAGSEELKVRFAGIDAPELEDESGVRNPLAAKAKERACNLVRGAKEILLETQEDDLYDRYGRLLAWVFADRELVQYQLVYEGLADTKYLNETSLYRAELLEAMRYARKYKRGIWETGE